MKRIIINADDFGSTKQINESIFRLIKNKKISSTSIMANGELIEDAIKKINILKKSKFSLGIHLNVTSGKSILNNLNIICGKEKLFNKSFYFFFFKLYFIFDKKKVLDEIYNEFNSQILFIKKKTKKNITHLDSHNHIHTNPLIFNILLKLSKRHKIKHIRYVNEELIAKNFLRKILKKLMYLNYIKYILIKFNNFLNRSQKSKIAFFGLIESGMIDRISFENILKYSKNKIIEIAIHPSLFKKKLITKHSHQKRDLKSYNSMDRVIEYENFRKLSHENKNYELINFNDI